MSSYCDHCSGAQQARLEQLGVGFEDIDHIICLAGNPNTGKSTVFNALTGLKQHTGNWPGKTIERAEGGFVYNDKHYKIVDLPGTYSLLSASPDEEVARDFILFGQPDVTVIVLDATRLERNLNLALQIFQITRRIVVAVNFLKEARSHNLNIDLRNLELDLGVPVVAIEARDGQGFAELLSAIAKVCGGDIVPNPKALKLNIPGLKGALNQVKQLLAQLYPQLEHKEWIALRLLAGDASVSAALARGDLENL